MVSTVCEKTGMKMYRCSLCSHQSYARNNMRAHLLWHTGLKPFKCNQCDYSSHLKGNLKSHLATHAGVKPYRCPECDPPPSMVVSVCEQSGAVLYSCSLWGYMNVRKAHLRTHLATHGSAERDFPSRRTSRATRWCIFHAYRSSVLEGDGMRQDWPAVVLMRALRVLHAQEGGLGGACAHPHGGEALPVRLLPLRHQHQEQPQQAHAKALRGSFIFNPLCILRFSVICKSIVVHIFSVS